jgi:hypothetical protein
MVDLEILRECVKSQFASKAKLIPFNVYPNPAKNSIIVNVNVRENCILEMYDSYGRQCININMEDATENLDLSSFSEGVYMLRLTNGNATVCKRIIIKR